LTNLQLENELSNLVEWLSDGQYQGEHRLRIEAQLSGTGEWFFKREEFMKWQDACESSIFWLHGQGMF